jgi:hydrogenase maturation protease
MPNSSRTIPTRAAGSGHDLVICYGNPLRGDDGMAWQVAQQLLDLKLERLEVIAVHQLMPELSEMVAQASKVVFVDASLEPEPGGIVVRELEPCTPSKTFTHHLAPENLLALAQTLYGARDCNALIVSVGVKNLECGVRLSAQVKRVIPKVLKLIRHILTIPMQTKTSQ